MQYPNHICQGSEICIYGRNDLNELVSLCPVYDSQLPSRIVDWVPESSLLACGHSTINVNSKMRAWLQIREWIDRSLDPICQDWYAVTYEDYKGYTVRQVPVVDIKDPSRITDWVADPEQIAAIERVECKKGYSECRYIDSDNLAQRSNKPDVQAIPTSSLILIDGSNVICYGDEQCLRGTDVLRSMVDALRSNGYECRVFVDSSMIGRLQHKEHDDSGLRYLKDGEKNGLITIAPGRSEADGQILQVAEFERNAHIITNDHYRDYVRMHPWLSNDKTNNRLHGINIVHMGSGRSRILIAGFNLDITV